MKFLMQHKIIQTLFLLFICIIHFDSSIAISRSPSGHVDLFTIKRAIENFVLQKLEMSKNEILMEFPKLDKYLQGITYTGEIRVLPSQNRLRTGNQIIKCGIFQQGQLKETLKVRVRIRTFQNVVVNKEKLGRHEILERSKINLSRRETTNILQKVYTTTDELVGLRTKRIIQPGEIITDKLVEPLPLITIGSEIDIYFQKGSLEIILPGISREDGYLDEEIRVKCSETKKLFKGKIIDSNTVIVKL